MILSQYTQNVLDLLNDPTQSFYPAALITRFINRARVQVAKNGQCIRLLTPGSASVSSFSQTTGGSGYTSPPTVTVSGPDMVGNALFTTATGTAVLSGGAVASITLTNGGSGYVKAPTVTLTGGGGSGAAFTANLGTHMTTTAGVELYTFASLLTALANTAVAGVIDVIGVSVAFAGTKPTLDQWDFASLQAYGRSWSVGQSYPTVWSKYAQGESGSFYLWPCPSDIYALEADCIVTPAALASDASVDLIPDNWTEAVFYYTAYLAYQNAFRFDSAKTMKAECDRLMREARANSGSLLIPTMYPSGS